ncbi:MAG: flagellar hook-associated protein FlgK [Janthinobacterium lividum]
MVNTVSNGGLTAATQNALSGINAANQKLGVISNNIVNGSTPGFSAKKIDIISRDFGGIGSGVQTNAPYRNTDEVLVEDIRVQSSEVNFNKRLNQTYQNIQEHFGTPGQHNSLGNQMRNFTNSVSAVATSPNSTILQNQVINAAKTLTAELGKLGTNVQSLRNASDQNIAQTVEAVNTALNTVNNLNTLIVQNQASGASVADYQDQRDQAVKTITEHMNITVRVQPSNTASQSFAGSIQITTGNGSSLLQGGVVTPLSFIPTTSIDATFNAPTSILLNGINIAPQITGGTLGADIQIRDTILPHLQNDLDTLTVQLRDSVNSVHNLGSGFPASQALTGQRSMATGGNTPFTGSGVVRVALVDLTSGNYIQAQDYDLSRAATLNDVMTNLTTTGSGGNIRVQLTANNQLMVSSTLPNVGVAVCSVGQPAHETMSGKSLGFSHYFGLNDFFVTPSMAVQDGQSIAGATNQLALRDDIKNTPSLMSRGQINGITPGPVAPGTPAIAQGDRSVMRSISDALNNKMLFQTSGNLTARSTTFAGYANDIIATNATATANNAQAYKTKNELLSASEKRLSDVSGVNLSSEVGDMMLTQKLLTSSARVLSVVKECFDILLKI